MGHEKPEAVKRAQHNEDYGALSAMGKKGAEHATQMRALEKARRAEELAKLAQEQAKLYVLSEE
ncbi:MAG: hypothetical protein WA053_02395, partial [Minisyncoccia bacterium]